MALQGQVPDVFGQGGDIQSRLAAALQDPQMRERLMASMPQIMQQLQAVGGPIGQRMGAGGVGGMPPALQAEMLRGGLAAPGGGSPPFMPPGDVTGGPVATLPFEQFNGRDGGSPPFVPDLDGGGSAPFFPPGDRQAFADLRNQYGNSGEMADRRRAMADASRPPRRDPNPQNEFEVMANTVPGSENERRELERVRAMPARAISPGLQTPPGGGQRPPEVRPPAPRPGPGKPLDLTVRAQPMPITYKPASNDHRKKGGVRGGPDAPPVAMTSKMAARKKKRQAAANSSRGGAYRSAAMV